LDLKHIRLLSEDDSTWHVQDGRDGSSFKVAKKGLSEGLHGAIVQHFAGGGEVKSYTQADALQHEAEAAYAHANDGLLQQIRTETDPLTALGIPSFGLNDIRSASAALDRAGVPAISPKDLRSFVGQRAGEKAASEGGKAPQGGFRGALGATGIPAAINALTPSQDTLSNLATTGKEVANDTLGALWGAPQTQSQTQGPGTPTEVAPGSPPLPAAAPSPTTSPAPSRPTGVGGGGFASELAGATKQAIGAETQRADLVARAAQEQAALQQQAQQKRDAIAQEWQQKWQQNQARADQLQQDLATGKVEPGRWWKNRDLGGKVSASIALVLGGIGQAFGGGENPALKVIGQKIADDIEAQKADLGKKQNLLSHYVQQGHDIQSAMQLAKADAMDAYAGQMQMVATRYAGPEAKVNADKAIAGIKMDATKARQQAFQQSFKNNIDLMEAQAKMMAAANAGAGRVPAKEAADVGGLKAANSMLADLDRLRKQKTGALSGVTQYLPGTDATQYRDATRVVAQTVGNILEGGKLSDADKPYYLSLLPTAGDSDERARAKLDFITRQLEAKAAGQVEGLGRAGYSTAGLQSMAQPPVQNPTGPSKVINGKTYVPTAQGWVEQ
jgi:hypothetical protein